MTEFDRTFLAYGIFAVPIGLVIGVIWWNSESSKHRLLPIQRRRKTPWTGIEVVFVFLVLELVQVAVFSLMDGVGFFERLYTDAEAEKRAVLWTGLLSTPLALIFIFRGLFYFSRTTPSDLGMTNARFTANVFLGYLVFALVTPLIFALLFAVTQFIPPDRHDLERLADEQLWIVEWVLLIFIAMVMAPVLEELAFRGALLRWLTKSTWAGHAVVAALAISVALTPTFEQWENHEHVFLAPALWMLEIAVLYVAAIFWGFSRKSNWPNPARFELDWEEQPTSDQIQVRANPPHGEQIQVGLDRPQTKADEPGVLRPAQPYNPLAAIIGTSMLFASFHSSVWPSPIPLFFMALVLGWLAYRTQSLVAPIVFHALFNGVSVATLMMSGI